MDGVLVDGEPLHFRAVSQLLADEGRAITLDQYRPYMGTKAGWAEFVTDFGLQHSREHYAPRYNELILEQYRSDHSGKGEGVKSTAAHYPGTQPGYGVEPSRMITDVEQ